MNSNKDITVGLFGTCGSSTWREAFIKEFEKLGIDYFNPQLPEGVWTADRADEFVQIENQNLKSNEIILFPVTDETTGQGSLAEIGFSVLDTLRNLNGRKLIVLIDEDCKCPKSAPELIEESKRTRKLVRSKLDYEANVLMNNDVYLVNDMDQMLACTLRVYSHVVESKEIKTQYLKAV